MGLIKRSRPKSEPGEVALSKTADELSKATGTEEPILQNLLINQTIRTLWAPDGISEDETNDLVQSTFLTLRGVGPTDEIEGMLASQMVATHNAAMECLRRAIVRGQTFEGRDLNMKHAEKFLSLYSRQIEVLSKYRSKGHQKVTVEYVNVESGGQAMVGHIESGKPATTLRREVKSKVKAISNNPDEAIDTSAAIKKAKTRKKLNR